MSWKEDLLKRCEELQRVLYKEDAYASTLLEIDKESFRLEIHRRNHREKPASLDAVVKRTLKMWDDVKSVMMCPISMHLMIVFDVPDWGRPSAD